MFHEANVAPTTRDRTIAFKKRIGARMFFLYFFFYAGFVLLNLFDPTLMEKPVFFGVNLAIVYGLLLIVGALIQALIYDAMCRAREKKKNQLT